MSRAGSGGRPRIAVVVGRSLEYGLQRMMQAYTNDWAGVMEFGIFYSVEEARSWLRGPAIPDS